jgi:hypothetical protein
MGEGSFIQDYPRILERMWQFAERTFMSLDPLWSRLGYDRLEWLMKPPEDISKKILFGCNECGQCVLHYTGMTCPMNCPKQLRNGPCGGVRPDGHCEVYPEKWCVWYKAHERTQKMAVYGDEIKCLQPMHNWERDETSAWVNMLREEHGGLEPSDPEELTVTTEAQGE